MRDMIFLVAIILISRVDCRAFLKDLDTPVFLEINGEYVDISNNDLDALLNVQNDDANGDELDFLSHEERIFSNKWKSDTDYLTSVDKDREFIQTYVLVKRVRQRNKRYVSYLTLCHFKICNIGKKRTPRYNYTLKRRNNM